MHYEIDMGKNSKIGGQSDSERDLAYLQKVKPVISSEVRMLKPSEIAWLRRNAKAVSARVRELIAQDKAEAQT